MQTRFCLVPLFCLFWVKKAQTSIKPAGKPGEQATLCLSCTMYFKDFCSQATVLNKQKSILNHEVLTLGQCNPDQRRLFYNISRGEAVSDLLHYSASHRVRMFFCSLASTFLFLPCDLHHSLSFHILNWNKLLLPPSVRCESEYIYRP